MLTSRFHAWAKRPMRVVGSADTLTPRSRPAVHVSYVGADEMLDEDIVQVPVNPVDRDFQGKEASAHPLGPQKNNRKSIWLSILQVDEVTNPIRVVLQKPESEFTESVKASEYQYSVFLMTVVNPVADGFSAVEVGDLLEQRRADSFLKKISRSLS